MPYTVVRPAQPDPNQADSIRALIARVRAEDGRDPLSDQALTQLISPNVEHAIALDGDRVLGYAQLAGRSLEIAAERGAIDPLLDAFGDRSVLVWTHGNGSRLGAILAGRGFTAQRELHQLRRPLLESISVPPVPEGVHIRAFVVGQDEQDQLRVNASAFAAHAEQGGWGLADLEAREREDWFDPSGFLLAWRAEELLGFHWTKMHSADLGEVYVLAVDPAAQGIGLGAVLLLRGLDHLRGRGCAAVLLYVDGSNGSAMRLYERYGFERHDLDLQWQSP